MKKFLAAVSLIALTLSASPAMARDWHHDNGWHNGWHHDRHESRGFFLFDLAPPIVRPVPVYSYYAPPPVAYYAPPPPPVYYRPVVPYGNSASFFFRFK